MDLSDNFVKTLAGGKANPVGLPALTNLIELSIAGNSLKGKVPQDLAALKKLTKLDLSSNKFSGRIPGVVTKFSLLKCVTCLAQGFALLSSHFQLEVKPAHSLHTMVRQQTCYRGMHAHSTLPHHGRWQLRCVGHH